MIIKWLLLSWALFFFLIAPTFAVKLSSLYQAELPVASQSSETRAEAVKEGFIQILIKLSGDFDITKHSIIKSSLARADYYVQEYSYSTPSMSSFQYQIKIRFDKEDVNRLLKKAGINFWGEQRPLILVWLTVNDQESSTTEIIGTETSDNLSAKVQQEAKKYGLPLIFPMMDVADINQVSTMDISNRALSVLKSAGKRYSADAFLIGNVEKKAAGYESQWELVLEDKQWDWSISDKNMQDVLKNILQEVTQTLAKHYIVAAEKSTPHWLKLKVLHVRKRNDLSQLLQYLKQLAPVTQTQLTEITGDVVEISVLIQGSLEGFKENAAIGKRLMLKSQDETKWVYEWLY